MAARRLDDRFGTGVSKGRWPGSASRWYVVTPSGADPHSSQGRRANVPTAHCGGRGPLDDERATAPKAGELRCAGPVHSAASNPTTPRQSTIASAHSGDGSRATSRPLVSYQSSSVSRRRFSLTGTVLSREVVAESRGEKMYSPLSFGVRAGRVGRHAYFREPRSLLSLRYLASRTDKMRTL